jgi:Zn-dependent peptidase ImmA (M78 family)
VDILYCLRLGTIWTVRGVKRLIYEIRNDIDMGLEDARTDFPGNAVRIRVKSSVHEALVAGHRRARFTLAHELGHAVLYDGIARPRPTGAAGSHVRKWEKPYEAPERLANKFAEAFLIDDATAEFMSSAAEISDHFGVSLKAAGFYFDRMMERRDRAKSAERVKQKAAAFISQKVPDPVLSCAYLEDPCPTCGHSELIQDGAKYTCMNCGRTDDHFQDGDRLSG